METESKNTLTVRNGVTENKRVKEKAIWSNIEMKQFREGFKRQYGFDPKDDKALPAGKPGFSWSKFKERAMRETNTASAQTQLLRAGVQVAVNNLYPAVKTSYEGWAHVVASNKDTELYAPLNALTFPAELGEGERYIESSVVGLDIKLRNKKFGQLFPVTMELLEDDQTGQFAQKVSQMADYAALVWEVYAYGKLNSIAAGSIYGGLTVPASETKPSYEANYPWAAPAAPLRGGGSTRPAAFGALTTANLQSAFVQLEEQLNLQALKMNVMPDKVICSPYNRFNLATILNSNFYPAGAQSAGVTGGSLAINVLQGIADPVVSRFVFDQLGSSANSKAWYVMDSSKPAFIVQIREAAKVVQEDPLSGQSFERDLNRWKLSLRGNADFIDPRFFFQGNDGSV